MKYIAYRHVTTETDAFQAHQPETPAETLKSLTRNWTRLSLNSDDIDKLHEAIKFDAYAKLRDIEAFETFRDEDLKFHRFISWYFEEVGGKEISKEQIEDE